MAASFTTFVGRPKAVSKSNPTQPSPRLTGSEATRPLCTGLGTPTETRSQSHPAASSSTAATMPSALIVGPESALRRSGSPLARTLTCEPPTSTTSTDAITAIIASHSRSFHRLVPKPLPRQARHAGTIDLSGGAGRLPAALIRGGSAHRSTALRRSRTNRGAGEPGSRTGSPAGSGRKLGGRGERLHAGQGHAAPGAEMLDDRLLLRRARKERLPGREVIAVVEIARGHDRQSCPRDPLEDLVPIDELEAIHRLRRPLGDRGEASGRPLRGRRDGRRVRVRRHERGAQRARPRERPLEPVVQADEAAQPEGEQVRGPGRLRVVVRELQ